MTGTTKGRWLGGLLLLIGFGGAGNAQVIFTDSFEVPSDLPVIPPSDEPPSARQQARPLGSTDAEQGFYEYLPPGYGDGQRYPLLIFVHGLGENGNGTTDLPRVLRNGPPRLINNNTWPNERPFVVLSPQNSEGNCTRPARIASLINFALTEYDIEPSRIYLTGLSCGAIASWGYAANELNTQIAAMVPIAGNGIGAFNNAGCTLGVLPIWAFHGDSDTTVGPNGSRVPIEQLLLCQPAPVDARLTIYPGVGHNSWRRTYDLSAGHDIYQWLLSHRNVSGSSP